MHYDLIIVGAGPAGSTLAREASRAGLVTLVLDKEPFPRYKPCGGAVSNRTAALLDFDISELVENIVDKLLITYKGGQPIHYTAPESFASMVMRQRFDAFLMEEAVEAGTHFLPSCKALSAEIHQDRISVETERGSLTGEVLIGADGVNGMVAKAAHLPGKGRVAVALEVEVPLNPGIIEKEEGRVHVDYGTIPYGYRWIFPKKEVLSIGVGTFTHGVKDLRRQLLTFIEGKRIAVDPASLKIYSHPIPIPEPGRRIHGYRTLLIGDAAGLADPFSGEGLLAAVKSAKLALPWLMKGFEKGDFLFSGYGEAINKELMGEFKTAKAVSSIFYKAPLLFHRAFKLNNRILDRFFQIVADNSTYNDLHSYLTSTNEISLNLKEETS